MNEAMEQDVMTETNRKGKIAPELKVGIYFCILTYALAAVIYCLC